MSDITNRSASSVSQQTKLKLNLVSPRLYALVHSVAMGATESIESCFNSPQFTRVPLRRTAHSRGEVNIRLFLVWPNPKAALRACLAKKKKTCFNQNIFQTTTLKRQSTVCRRTICSGELVAFLRLALTLIWFVIFTNSHLLSCQSREPWLCLRGPLSHLAVSLGIWPAPTFMNTTSVTKPRQGWGSLQFSQILSRNALDYVWYVYMPFYSYTTHTIIQCRMVMSFTIK